MDLAHFLSLSIGAGVLLILGGILLRYFGVYQRFRLAFLRRFSGEVAQEAIEPTETTSLALRRDERRPRFVSLLPGLPDADHFAAFYAEMRRATAILVICITSLVISLLYTTLELNVVLGLCVGVLVSGVVWYLWVRMRYQKRLFKIAETVPEALDLIVRALRVGLPIGTAIQTAGQELVGPLAVEFAETSRRISYGQELIRALRDMAERCDNQNLRFFAAAVALQSVTGGNLAEVLERLCQISRGRQQLLRKVRSITAEAKWSGRFLSFFPFIATAMLLMINPNYFADIAGQSFFLPMLGLVGFLLMLNMLFMRWLVKIE